MSLDGRFQLQSKYNLEKFSQVWPIPYISNIPRVFRREKTRCYTKTDYARRLESRFDSLLTKVVIIAKRFKFRFALCVSFWLSENMNPFFFKL